MKNAAAKYILTRTACLIPVLLAAAHSLHAATIYKANNTDNLNLASAWTNNAAPGTSEPVLTALERLGAPAAGAVFVGDSRHDVECGRAAGVKTAAVLWGPFDRSHLEDLEPDYWLETPADLTLLAPDT